MRSLLVAVALLLASPALAQHNVTQSGNVTPGHPVQWKTNGVVSDAGPATQGTFTGIGTQASGPSICANSGPVTQPYNQICLGATATGGTLSFNNVGATGTLSITVNGSQALGPVLGLGTMSLQNANAVNILGGSIVNTAINGGTISNLPTPSSASSAATKSYVDISALGYVIHNPARLATTTTLPTYTWSSTGGGTLTATANAALTIDGVAVSTSDRILVKNELSSGTACNGNINSACDGIYTVTQTGSGGTPYILTRASALNTKGNAENVAAGWPGGDSVLVTAGTVNTGTTWLNTAAITTLNTTAFLFTQLSSTTSSPWQISGANIYYTAGLTTVGPGAASPTGFGYFEANNGTGTSQVSAIASISAGLVGGTVTNTFGYNYFQITGEQQGSVGTFDTAAGLYVFMTDGGTLESGWKDGLKVFLWHNVATPANGKKGDHNGIDITTYGTVNDGGTSSGNPAGTLYGMTIGGVADNGATFLNVVSSGEIHAEIRTGASANHRWGWSMVSSGQLHGTLTDAAIEFSTSGTSIQWNNILFLTQQNGSQPLDPTNGCVICTDSQSATIKTGIDLSSYTITGNFLKSTGFSISGSGFAGINGADFSQMVYYVWGGVTLTNGLNSNIDIGTKTPVRISGPTGAFSVGGFTLDFGNFDGQLLYLFNNTAQAMTIVNEDASSSATNRITTLTGGNVTLRSGKSFASFLYDISTDRWILMGTN